MEKLVRKRGTTLVVGIPKEVDHCFAEELREYLDRKVQTENIKVLEFDFQDTEFMDSSGIGLLMGRFKLMRALGGAVHITNAGERIRFRYFSAGSNDKSSRHSLSSEKKEHPKRNSIP